METLRHSGAGGLLMLFFNGHGPGGPEGVL